MRLDDVLEEVDVLPQLRDLERHRPNADVQPALTIPVFAVALAEQFVNLFVHHGVQAVLQQPPRELVEVQLCRGPSAGRRPLRLPRVVQCPCSHHQSTDARRQ